MFDPAASDGASPRGANGFIQKPFDFAQLSQKLAQILGAALLAPTAANRQPFRLIVLRTAGREEELRRISPDRRSGGRSTNW